MSEKTIRTIGGKMVESDCASHDKDCKNLNVMGTQYVTTFTKKYAGRKEYKTPDLNKVHAVIPGTIREVYAKAGDLVEEGETVLVLEAMKMYNRIAMPVSGKLKGVYVAENEAVPKNTLLFEIEVAGD